MTAESKRNAVRAAAPVIAMHLLAKTGGAGEALPTRASWARQRFLGHSIMPSSHARLSR